MSQVQKEHDYIGVLRILCVLIILSDYNQGVFTENTKFHARLLRALGDNHTRLVQIYANGNTSFPEDVNYYAHQLSGLG